jgi:hypothetical protein
VMVSTSEVGLTVLPRSLRFMDDVRAARTKEKVGPSGRDDREEQEEAGTHPSQPARRVGHPPWAELFGMDELPVRRRKAEGPKIRGRIFKLEGDGEHAVLRFAYPDHTTGHLCSTSGVEEPNSVVLWQLEADFEQATVGIDHQRKRVHGDKLSIVEPRFQEQMDLQQDTLASPPRYGIGSRPQFFKSTPRSNLILFTTGF